MIFRPGLPKNPARETILGRYYSPPLAIVLVPLISGVFAVVQQSVGLLVYAVIVVVAYACIPIMVITPQHIHRLGLNAIPLSEVTAVGSTTKRQRSWTTVQLRGGSVINLRTLPAARAPALMALVRGRVGAS